MGSVKDLGILKSIAEKLSPGVTNKYKEPQRLPFVPGSEDPYQEVLKLLEKAVGNFVENGGGGGSTSGSGAVNSPKTLILNQSLFSLPTEEKTTGGFTIPVPTLSFHDYNLDTSQAWPVGEVTQDGKSFVVFCTHDEWVKLLNYYYDLIIYHQEGSRSLQEIYQIKITPMSPYYVLNVSTFSQKYVTAENPTGYNTITLYATEDCVATKYETED